MSSSGNNTALRPCLGHAEGEAMPMGVPGTEGREQGAASGGYGGRSVEAQIRAAGSMENCQERS